VCTRQGLAQETQTSESCGHEAVLGSSLRSERPGSSKTVCVLCCVHADARMFLPGMRQRLSHFSELSRTAASETSRERYRRPVDIVQGLTGRCRSRGFLCLLGFVLIEGDDGVEEHGCPSHDPMRARARERQSKGDSDRENESEGDLERLCVYAYLLARVR